MSGIALPKHVHSGDCALALSDRTIGIDFAGNSLRFGIPTGSAAVGDDTAVAGRAQVAWPEPRPNGMFHRP